LAIGVAKSGADFPDTLEETVVANMHVRPDRRCQLLFAEQAVRIGSEQTQKRECFRPQPYRFAVFGAKFAPFEIKLEPSKAEHGAS
jgi:hypothetical protein